LVTVGERDIEKLCAARTKFDGDVRRREFETKRGVLAVGDYSRGRAGAVIASDAYGSRNGDVVWRGGSKFVRRGKEDQPVEVLETIANKVVTVLRLRT
jgi:hypothetical protein